MTVSLVALCRFAGECYFKRLKRNGYNHGWKKALTICVFEGNCNHKVVMDHVGASRKHGITK